MIQHWQSSPHQQGSLTPGVFRDDFPREEEVEDVAEVVDGATVEGGILLG